MACFLCHASVLTTVSQEVNHFGPCSSSRVSLRNCVLGIEPFWSVSLFRWNLLVVGSFQALFFILTLPVRNPLFSYSYRRCLTLVWLSSRSSYLPHIWLDPVPSVVVSLASLLSLVSYLMGIGGSSRLVPLSDLTRWLSPDICGCSHNFL